MATIPPGTVEVTTAHKPGWKTTEFWVTQLTIAAVVAGALDGVLPPKYAALVAAFSQAAYAIARGITKSGSPALVSSDAVPTDSP